MWAPLRKLFGLSRVLHASLGEVVLETSAVTGQKATSLLQWRVKRGLDGKSYYVGLKILPDASTGGESVPKNYINFDLETAEKLRTDLDRCIAECRQLTERFVNSGELIMSPDGNAKFMPPACLPDRACLRR